ncbi:hypothetical protein DNTS_007752 [Danionella cerebrum]|uniref:DC-UbP/UBTD2 N-terminal domain-containing protein n=1 Tax=Danionella cerebrum TaxID=2873325 RepID=A0A553QTL1_9TELE|nr:hypothetical protein DNTS_007752 [Danionella translucida]
MALTVMCLSLPFDAVPPAVFPGFALGRNQPLKREKPKWKSDYPMTDGQLRSKRDEFWDTAPAFEGRKEIWDALRAAAQAFESNDHELAQAIIDGASITVAVEMVVNRADVCWLPGSALGSAPGYPHPS